MELPISPRRVASLVFVAASIAAASTAHAQETVWRAYGSLDGQYFGAAVDVFHDVDGDGIVDLIVGAPGPSSLISHKSCVKIVSGADGSTLSTVLAPKGNDRFGSWVATVGDLDFDGTPDYVVGAPAADVLGTDAGAVYAISGATGVAIYEVDGGRAGDQLGATVAALGDVDGDGVGDVVAGSFGQYAAMVSGATGSVIATLCGTKPSTNFVFAVAGGGDLDGDGVPDVAVGDLGSSLGTWFGGAVSLFSGATGKLLYEIGSPAPAAFFGVVSFVEDVDGDGTSDLFIGAPLDSTYAVSGGSAWLVSGRTGTFLTGFVPGGATAGGWMMGTSVSSAGDTNGDGFVDWLIGAPGYAGSPAQDRGTVFLMSGRDGGMLYHFEAPAGTWHGLGTEITKPRDLDQDGIPDFIFGSPEASTNTLTGCGDVSIRKGHPFWLDSTPRIAVANQPVTFSIAQVRQFSPYALFLRGLNGTPCFTLLGVGSLDVAGRATLSGNLPPGLGANTIDFQALTFDYQGKLLFSGVETLTTQ